MSPLLLKQPLHSSTGKAREQSVPARVPGDGSVAVGAGLAWEVAHGGASGALLGAGLPLQVSVTNSRPSL